MFKPFFVHYHPRWPGKMRNGKKARAFTAYLAPHLTDDTKMILGIAFCSHKDEFNKKMGRAISQVETIVIDKKKLPFKLKEYAEHVDEWNDQEWRWYKLYHRIA